MNENNVNNCEERRAKSEVPRTNGDGIKEAQLTSPFAPMPPMNGVQGIGYGAPRLRKPIAAAKAIFPQWLSRNALIVYFLALAIVSFMYSAYSMPWYYMLSGVVAVMVFFLYGSTAIKDTLIEKIKKEKRFEKRIFLIAFIPRVIWMFLIYTIFINSYGDAFGFENGDATYYDTLGQFVAGLIKNGNFHFYDEISKWSGSEELSDMGYGIYVGLIYMVSGSEGVNIALGLGGTPTAIVALRLMKCVWSSLTVILLYRLAKRNFDMQTARVAAIYCALWPNFWYYCGAHLKETEMVFLGVLFVEQADQMLRSRQFTTWKAVPVLLIAAIILTFRTPLALVAFLSLIFSVVMSSTRVVSWGKRIAVGGLAVLLLGVGFGNQLEEKTRDLFEQAQSDQQKSNMEWRSSRENGNALAKYAGKSVFAPLIFTIPFPSMTRPYAGQDVQQLLNGGNFVKNILSGFTIFAMVMLLISGKWREHLLPLSFLLGYLVVLTMSTFAQSERFHQPAMPFEFMFAAYGLSIAVTQKKYKRWFTYWCGLMFIAAIAWNWFKMAGRGLA